MNSFKTISLVALMLAASSAAAIDSQYYLADAMMSQQVRTYSDGKNTYIDAIPGLIVRGATADGDSYVMPGVPREIKIQLNGRQTSLIHGQRQTMPAGPSARNAATADIVNKIERLELKLKQAEGARSSNDGVAYLSDDETVQGRGDPVQQWDVRPEDIRLANTFERWAKTAGWRIQWDANKHLLIESTSTFTGSFEDAVKAALMTPGIRYGAYPLEACVYANSPPLVRITRQGEQSQECPD
ncbi:TcpQ domain-containing protein [Janthinobacterium lividum]|jgi:hypothetical protein|uniref:TcpQ domain-containing protein n=1 Tax=unclassified Janthinobacterium TaxID=2610881 RepID=UPI000AADFB96|nr:MULTISPECIES: TcpQ domain-containing protein [unclassified Janthinobacterium]PHV23302.1 hypothetical protein CSQ92_10005 [Janthinobacterium sp. BJB446]